MANKRKIIILCSAKAKELFEEALKKEAKRLNIKIK